MTEAAFAKVNLFLHVVGRRADGFHLLDSLAVFPAVGDRLRLERGGELSLGLDGPFGAALVAEPDNLVLRAARVLAEASGVAPLARMVLTKNLPVASGIGGGSADAAAALRGLARLWGVAPLPVVLAAGLGADVPVCLASRPCRMGGVGDLLAPAPAVPPGFLVLVNPGVAVSTPAVFRARAGDFSGPALLPAGWPDIAAMAEDLRGLSNDLESPAISLQPVIATVLGALRAQAGCLLARMSGSGATCFGLFAHAAEAAAAAEGIARPGWWTWHGGLAATDAPT